MDAYFTEISSIVSNPSWGVLIALFLLAFGFFYFVSIPKRKIISFILSVYLAGFIFSSFPYLDLIISAEKSLENLLFTLAFFGALIVVIDIILLRAGVASNTGERVRLWLAFLATVVTTGIFISFLFNLFKIDEVLSLPLLAKPFFTSSIAFFWWLVAPLGLFFLIKKE